MKVKDLIEQLSKLNPEAEIGPAIIDIKPSRRISYYEGCGWVEEEIEYCFCGAEACSTSTYNLCEEHLGEL